MSQKMNWWRVEKDKLAAMHGFEQPVIDLHPAANVPLFVWPRKKRKPKRRKPQTRGKSRRTATNPNMRPSSAPVLRSFMSGEYEVRVTKDGIFVNRDHIRVSAITAKPVLNRADVIRFLNAAEQNMKLQEFYQPLVKVAHHGPKVVRRGFPGARKQSDAILLNTTPMRPEAANRKSLSRIVAMPSERGPVPIGRTFSPEEYQRISVGFVPRQMEDRWLAYLEGDWLYFHRSWTGHCIYKVRLEPTDRGHRTAEAWVNRNKQQMKIWSRRREKRTLERLIKLLIGAGLEECNEP